MRSSPATRRLLTMIKWLKKRYNLWLFKKYGFTVHTGDKSIKYLRDFDWIKRVELECVHYIPTKPLLRET